MNTELDTTHRKRQHQKTDNFGSCHDHCGKGPMKPHFKKTPNNNEVQGHCYVEIRRF